LGTIADRNLNQVIDCGDSFFWLKIKYL
jgi:hypothetical protein